MPPKAKFTKEQIISKAFEITKSEGIDVLTARYLGEKLGSSARPIFTVFSSMDEVVDGVIKSAKELYNSYIVRGLSESIPFKGVGTQYIMFAAKEPKLFELLFMTKFKGVVIDDILPIIDENSVDILQSVKDTYAFNEKQAMRLYRHLWVYTHGIATLLVRNTCTFSAETLSNMLTDVCMAIVKRIKEENHD